MSTQSSKAAICYGRFSTSEQSKGFSLERQKLKGAEFAAEHGWFVEKTITDEGRSAFHGANRSEGSALHQFELEARNGLHKGKALGEYVTHEGKTLSTSFYEPAITTEKWNRVQAQMAMRKSNHKRGPNLNRNLLTQMVFCSECGGGAAYIHPTETTQSYTTDLLPSQEHHGSCKLSRADGLSNC